MNIQKYVILLEDDRERTEHVNANLPDFKIFPATTKANIGPYYHLFTRKYIKTTPPAKLACTISHLRLWKKIVDEKIGNTLIFEDDMIKNNDFDDMLPKIFGELPKDYDILYLWIHDKYYNPLKNRIRGLEHINGYYFTWGRAAYLLSYKGACRLLGLFNDVNDHGDNFMAGICTSGKIKAFNVRYRITTNLGQIGRTYAGEKFKSNIWN